MKRLINLIILLSVFVSFTFPQKTVAVLDFDVNNVSKSDVRALSQFSGMPQTLWVDL